MRGRRVALLLTGLWPLLAKDDVPKTDTNVTADADEIHVPPSLEKEVKRPLDVLTTSNPSNIVMVDHALDTNDVLEEYIEFDDRIKADQHAAAGSAKSDDRQEAQANADDESISDEPKISSNTNEPEDISDAPTQDDPETNEAIVSDAQVPDDDADDNEKAEPADAQPIDSSDETQTDNETIKAESSESDDNSQVQIDDGSLADSEAAPPMDEDEDDVGTDRVLVDYASKSAGAIILEKSPAMKGTSNLLNGDNDKYAIAPCAEKKFVVINLSEDILVKQVKLANYERYSSQLKDFQIMGSQTMGDWVDLGTYTAEPGNGEQAFDLKEPAWARYLKFKFLTHHGSEHYCTYSQIQVHGSTMLQGFHEQWDSQEDLGEDDDAESIENNENGKPSQGDESKKPDDSESNKDKESPKATDTQAEGVETVPDSTVDDGTTKTDIDSPATDNDDDNSESATIDAEVDQGASTTDEATEQTPDPHQNPSKGKAEKKDKAPPADQGLPQTPTLSCVSIDISSHVAANTESTGSIEQLDISSIKRVNKGLKSVVTTVVKDLVQAEALMTVDDARTVSHEFKDIQESLKAPSFGSIVLQEDNKGEVESTTETREPEDQIVEDSTPAATEIVNDENKDKGQDDSTVTQTKEASVETNREEQEKDHASSHSSQDAKRNDGIPKQEESPIKAKTTEKVAELVESVEQTVLDPALSGVIARFPSAACMEGLDYQDFKARIVAARKERASAQGGQYSPGKNEPIFKLLTDEIKGLQTSQSAQDQYMKALMACYQQVMLEMAETLSHVETRQEKRLLDLEKAMEASNSSFFVKALNVVTAVISSVVFGARFIYTASDTGATTFIELGLVDGKITALLLFAACSVGMFLLGYRASAFCHKNPKSSPIDKKATQNTVKATSKDQKTTKESEHESPPTVVHMPSPTKTTQSSVVSDAVHSENESDTSEPVASVPITALTPRPLKHPDVQHEPFLVPE